MQAKFLEYAFKKLFASEEDKSIKANQEEKSKKPAKKIKNEVLDTEKKAILLKELLATKKAEKEIAATDKEEAGESLHDKNVRPDIKEAKVAHKKNDTLSILEKDAINKILYTFLLTEADFDQLEQLASRLPVKLQNKLKDLEEEKRYNELEFISEEAALKQERDKEEQHDHKHQQIEQFDILQSFNDQGKAPEQSEDDAEVKKFDKILHSQPQELTKVLAETTEGMHENNQLLEHCLHEMINENGVGKLAKDTSIAKLTISIDDTLQPLAKMLTLKLESMSKEELTDLCNEIAADKTKSFVERVSHSREKQTALQP